MQNNSIKCRAISKLYFALKLFTYTATLLLLSAAQAQTKTLHSLFNELVLQYFWL